MPPQLALFICIIFILFLFARDRKLRPMTSRELWIPLLWIVIIGTRPVSLWFGGGLHIETPDDYLAGSPLDRMVFSILIISGLMVLLRRKLNWRELFASNRLLFAFFLYCGISVIWSDYSFVSFKRWLKDIGNVVIVLIILTESNPVMAFKAVFARFTCLAVPLSVLFIKYFPEVGRYYDPWTWKVTYGGIAIGKNALGGVLLICGLIVVWDLIQMWTDVDRKTDKADLLSRFVLLSMLLWMFSIVNSSTSLVCFILGTGILIFMQYPLVQKQIKYLGIYCLITASLILFVYFIPGILETFTKMVGRDVTLTGRTDIWALLLREPINPIFGKGFQSFWLGPTAERLWEMYYFHPTQAHNGYLETYLNGGLIGLCLLMTIIISVGSKLKKELLLGINHGILLFSFFIVTIAYNWTEAVYNKLSLFWLVFLFAALTYPPSSEVKDESTAKSVHGSFDRTSPKPPKRQ